MSREENVSTLLSAALAELESEIMPEVAGRQRFSAAMIRRALSVMLRELQQGDLDIDNALLRSVYGESMTEVPADTPDLQRLSQDIRSRRLPVSSNLTASLRHYVSCQLMVKNPEFLKIADPQDYSSRTTECHGDNT